MFSNQKYWSLTYFYFYYHIKKFLNYRNFRGYNLKPLEKESYLNSLYTWEDHHIYYHPQIHYTEKELKRTKKTIIRNIHRDGKWEKYQTRGKKRDISKDYLKLIQTSGNGLTKLGQLLFQESNQAYVYSVLGAQAKTHWKIIGDGANSLQTQNVFKTLVNEVIDSNNLSNLIKSMRLAITATKVRLDFCISPGLELLPSNMIFIKDSPGYNNILLISNSNKKFGSNSSVNTIKKRVERYFSNTGTSPKKEVDKSTLPEGKDISPPAEKIGEEVANVTGSIPLVIAGSISAIILRILWLSL